MNGQQHESLSPRSRTLSIDQTSLAIYKHSQNMGEKEAKRCYRFDVGFILNINDALSKNGCRQKENLSLGADSNVFVL